MFTDSNGDYSATYSVGDSLLNTLSVRIFAYASGFSPEEQYTTFLSSLEDHSNINFSYGTSTSSTTYDTIAVYLTCPQTSKGVNVRTNFILYKVTSVSTTTADSVWTTEGAYKFHCPGGRLLHYFCRTGQRISFGIL